MDVCLRRNPSDANARYLRGVALTMQGDLDTALQDVTKAIESTPDYIDAIFQRAVILERQGKREQARGTYEQVVRLCQSASSTDVRLRIQCDRHLSAARDAVDRLTP